MFVLRLVVSLPSSSGMKMVRRSGTYSKRDASAREKMTTSSLVAVLMSWCMLKAFTPVASWTSDSNMGRATSSSRFRACLMRPEDARRKAIAAPPFGQIKHCRGFRQFLLRSMAKMKAGWQLVALTHNLLKLFRTGALATNTIEPPEAIPSPKTASIPLHKQLFSGRFPLDPSNGSHSKQQAAKKRFYPNLRLVQN